MRIGVVIVLLGLVGAGCGSDGEEVGSTAPPADGVSRDQDGREFPPAPQVPDGPLADDVVADVDLFFSNLATDVDIRALTRIGDAGDARLAWLMSDVLRFTAGSELSDVAVGSFERLTGVSIVSTPSASTWQTVTDHLMSWELPAPPGYVQWKGQLFTLIEPKWAPFFDDPDGAIDWRFLSWGGVRLDDRPLGDPLPCPGGCIPALDDPALTDALAGAWYPDDSIVFGVVVGDETVAFPKNIMEVHEMVNMTIGGRRVGIPYCTLCGSAQVYFTDSVEDGIEIPVLRTSGLLSRSNKVMFDLTTFSAFDTFTGEALTGPLHAAAVTLEQTTVVTSTWGDWKSEHPDTRIVAEDGGIGRTYRLDPLAGRDDDGPIFPIGDVDERLPVHALILGVEAPDGTPLAFPVDAARVALDAGQSVELLGVRLVPEGSGVKAELTDGSPIVGHQSFWFAWSQFMPDTLVWTPALGG